MALKLYLAKNPMKTDTGVAFYAPDLKSARGIAGAFYGQPSATTSTTVGELEDYDVDSAQVAAAKDLALDGQPRRFVQVTGLKDNDEDDDW